MPSTIRSPRIGLAGALAALVLVVAACSTTGADLKSAAASAAGAAASVAASAAGDAAPAVAIANGTVGAYLTGKDGMTLYVFKADSANTSTCTDACATNWPPFTVAAGVMPKGAGGVTGTLSTFARPDGTLQVTYDGAPLYYFAKDAKAGDTNGQGIGGKWFVASPAGASASPASSGKPGY